MFKMKGIIRVAKNAAEEDKLMEAVLDAGADDMSSDDDGFEITTGLEAYERVKEALKKIGVEPVSAELAKVADNTVKVEGETAGKVLKIIEILDDHDDVQHVYSNFEMSDEDMQKYGGGE